MKLFKNQKLDEFLFFTSYVLFICMNIVHDSFLLNFIGITIFKAVILGCGLLLLVKESFSQTTPLKVINLILISLVCFLLMVKNSDGFYQLSISFTVLYIISARTIPFKKLLHVAFYAALVPLCIVILFSQTGIIKDYIAFDGGRNRHYLGFLYALYPSTVLFNAMGLKFVQGTNSKSDLLFWLLCIPVSYWIYQMTDSRTCFVMSLFIILLHFILSLNPSFLSGKMTKTVISLSLQIFCCISLFLTIHFDSSVRWQAWLNDKLANRLELGQQSLDTYGVKPFGQIIQWIGNGLNEFGEASDEVRNWVDCFYVKILQRYGSVFFAGWLFAMTSAMFRCSQKNMIRLLILCAIVAAHCMIDDLSLFMHFNSTWFLMGTILFNSKEKPSLSTLDSFQND